jgi:hypothetical protein
MATLQQPRTEPRPALVYRPQPKQEAWHRCWAYESGFGGAKFGGKSLALLMEATRYLEHPRYRGIIFRREYPRLEELMGRAWDWYPGLSGHWSGDHRRWTFRSGAQILFRHCQNEEDKRSYQGHEYQFMAFDQLEEFTDTQYSYLLAQNRSGVAELAPYTRSTFNPGGVGHGWVKTRFIDHGTTTCEPWTPTDDVERPLVGLERCFHFANIDDNPAGQSADPTYRLRLENEPEADRRAHLYGDWDVFAGQFFREWRRHRHVCEPFEIPQHWTQRRLAVDFGLGAPFCCLLFVRDEDALRQDRVVRWYCYRELYGAGYRDDEQAEMIADAIEGETFTAKIADPSMFNRQPNGQSIANVYAKAGVGVSRGNNDRVPGWQAVRRLLADQADAEPGLIFFSTCRNATRTFPALVHDPSKVEDLDTTGEDHAADACRYFAMSLGNTALDVINKAVNLRYGADLAGGWRPLRG